MSMEAPANWLPVSFDDVFTQVSTSGKKVKTGDALPEGEFPVVDQGRAFISGYLDDAGLVVADEKPLIIFGDHTREIKWIDFPFIPGADGVKILKPNPEMDGRFLFFFLRNLPIESKGYARHFKIVKDAEYLAPPLAEQTRIAAKLDELLAQVDTLKARIDGIPALLKRFRQSVLSAAVSGRLTEEWRGSGCGEWGSGVLGEFVGIDVGYAFKSSEFSTTGVRLLRGQNIEPGALRWTETKFYPEEKLAGLEGLFIADGDIILAMDRPIVSAGLKLARAKKEDLPCVLVQRVSRFKEFRGVAPGYLMLLLSDLSFSNYLLPNQTGSDIPHISGKQILSYPVTLPPIAEQTEIVRRVEQLFAFADQLEAKVSEAKTRIDRLTQSILAKAFRGELVPQDPNDEPASVLLQRIQAQRANAPKARRGRKVLENHH